MDEEIEIAWVRFSRPYGRICTEAQLKVMRAAFLAGVVAGASSVRATIDNLSAQLAKDAAHSLAFNIRKM